MSRWRRATLLAAARHAEEVGFDAAMSSDHFAPWSARQGESGFAWSWLGAALATHLAAVRCRHGAGSALSPGGHRAGDRHAAGDVPRPALGGARHRRGVERAHHGRPLAGQGDPQRPAWPSASRCCAPCSPARRSPTTDWSRSTAPGCGRCLPAPPMLLGAAVSPATAAWVGGWADGVITMNQDPADLRALLDAFRSGGGGGKPAYLQAHVCWAGHRGRGAGDRPRPVAQQRLRPAGVLGSGAARPLRRGGPSRPPRRRPQCGARVGRSGLAPATGSPSWWRWGSTGSGSTTSASSSNPSSTCSANTSSRACGRHEPSDRPASPRRPTCGGRTRSSTASTCRRSPTPTATASATSPD